MMIKSIIRIIAALIAFIWFLAETAYKYSHCTEVVEAELEDIRTDSYKGLNKPRRYKFNYTFTYKYDGKEYSYFVIKNYSVYEPGEKYYLRIDPVCPWEYFDPVRQAKKIVMSLFPALIILGGYLLSVFFK